MIGLTRLLVAFHNLHLRPAMPENESVLDELHAHKTRMDFNFLEEDTQTLIHETLEGVTRVNDRAGPQEFFPGWRDGGIDVDGYP